MNKDEFILHEWEKEQLDAMVRENELELAKEEGISQGINLTIKSMLENKVEYDFISKVTGKTIEEIKEIEKSMEVE